MSDVIDQLRDSYTTRTTAACDAEALIDAATAKGTVLRRAHHRRRFSALVVITGVVVGAASIAIAAWPDRGLRVETTESTTFTSESGSALPIATVREFPDLDRLRKFLIGEVARDAQSVQSARAEVVQTTSHAFAARSVAQIQRPGANVAVYAVQLTGTTFVCHDCFTAKPSGPAMLIEWDPLSHTAMGTEIGGKPIDLSTLGRVYRIVLHDTRPSTSTEVCTQADLDKPPLAMPAPQRITRLIVLTQLGNLARLDPAPTADVRVSAATAWNDLTRYAPAHAGSAELLLGYYASVVGPKGPQGHILAWVLRLHHLAFTGFQGGPGGFGGTPTSQRPVCIFTNAYLVLDATTGKDIVDTYGN